MEYLKVYTDFEQALEPYGDAEAGRIFRAMLRYAEDGTEPNFRGNERFIWPTAKLNIDRTRAEAERNSRNRSQRPATTANDPQRPATTANDGEPKRKEKKEKENNTTPTPPFEGQAVEVLRVWEQTIGEVPRVVVGEVVSYLQAGLSAELIGGAIKEAAKNGAPKWAYVEAILKRCAKEGITTLAELEGGGKGNGANPTDGINWGEFGTNT